MSMQALVELPRVATEAIEWRDVCAIDDVHPGTGVAALIDGEQIAIVRTRDGRCAALSNFDPFSNAFVIARGIVGDRAGVPKIASPIYKQNFSLETGECLDDPSVRLAVFPIRVVGGRIQVSVAPKDSE
jgi:nitrite reductase (NADH) small subunit